VKACWTVLAAVLAVAPVAVWGQDCDEEVIFEVYDGTIEIIHNQSLYNCCCWIEFDVIQEAFAIDVMEWEELDAGGCDCLCCIDMRVKVAGLEPGEYTVTIWKHSESGGVEMLGPWVVTVTGTCPPSLTASYLPCVNTWAPEDDAVPGTWGTIKALYQ
jgi:hypothetical protein